MHIGGVLVFDPLPGGGTPTLDAAAPAPRAPPRRSCRAIASGSRAARPAACTGRRGSADEQFDIAAHVTRAALPKPGGERELLAWAADFWSHRLDRARPLWRIVLLEGLAGGRWALVTKTHHCLVDGVGSVDAGSVLLDAEPKPRAPQARRRARPGPAGPAAGRCAALARSPFAAAEAAVDAVRHPRRAAEALDSARALVELLVRDELVAAPQHEPQRRRSASIAGIAVTRGPAGGAQGDQARARRHRQRRRPRARHRAGCAIC